MDDEMDMGYAVPRQLLAGYVQSPDLAERGARFSQRVEECKERMGSKWVGYNPRREVQQ